MAITIRCGEVIDELNNDLRHLRNPQEFLVALMETGVQSASQLPAEVYVEANNDTASLVATGDQVAFAEFGTGIHAFYPQPTQNLVAETGSWSQGIHGMGHVDPNDPNPGWWYNGQWTQGEVPMLAMYDAAEQIDRSINDVAEDWING